MRVSITVAFGAWPMAMPLAHAGSPALTSPKNRLRVCSVLVTLPDSGFEPDWGVPAVMKALAMGPTRSPTTATTPATRSRRGHGAGAPNSVAARRTTASSHRPELRRKRDSQPPHGVGAYRAEQQADHNEQAHGRSLANLKHHVGADRAAEGQRGCEGGRVVRVEAVPHEAEDRVGGDHPDGSDAGQDRLCPVESSLEEPPHYDQSTQDAGRQKPANFLTVVRVEQPEETGV